jgi:hypothetical protein
LFSLVVMVSPRYSVGYEQLLRATKKRNKNKERKGYGITRVLYFAKYARCSASYG